MIQEKNPVKSKKNSVFSEKNFVSTAPNPAKEKITINYVLNNNTLCHSLSITKVEELKR